MLPLIVLQDNNMGLVNLVQRSAVVRAVQRLTSTYLTLSLADIAKAAGLPNAAEAEMFMLRWAPLHIMRDQHITH